MISFYLNGKYHEISQLNPNTTVLEYLRLHARQMDTKEGCGSGDCGACTVMAQRLPNSTRDSNDAASINNVNSAPFYTFNACITLLSLMDNHHIMTSSFLADNPEHHPERALLHPAQQAMVDCHGSQCGFCTPGFIMSLASVYENNRQQPQSHELSYDEIVASISGNLCRCTGYRPIIDAGLAMQKIGQKRDEEQVAAKDLAIDAMAKTNSHDLRNTDATNNTSNTNTNTNIIAPALSEGSKKLFIPTSVPQFNQLLMKYPMATIWAGGTDLGLTITQRLTDHEVIIQLSGVDELKQWSLSPSKNILEVNNNKTSASSESEAGQELIFGAGMTYQQMLPILEQHFPPFAALFARTASPQIRNMGTLGGNIANASPIGDLPPVLLALESKVHLRHCSVANSSDDANDHSDNHNEEASKDNISEEIISLAEFFLDYKKTKLRAGSYVVAVHIPLMQDHQQLFIHKISKRYEDDISACLLATKIDLSADGTIISNAKIGLGGMAAVPLLAKSCQQALIGQPFEVASFEKAAKSLPLDVTPMTDVRASREYRMHVVQRLLVKCAKQMITDKQAQGATL